MKNIIPLTLIWVLTAISCGETKKEGSKKVMKNNTEDSKAK